MLQPKTYEDAERALGAAQTAWEKFIATIRANYMMDETWTSGKSTGKLNNYCNELKFRRGGKTLVAFYLRDGFFKACIVLGKDERVKFEEKQAEFSDTLQQIYAETPTYHDGKWISIEVYDEALIDDIIRLLRIKRKPNRHD
ncbi:hypothetical protein FACS1894217_14990 [Clostridia bacterium]|nr:hypothetical protein FACS1894217_14990 [Clostridia bacterium]